VLDDTGRTVLASPAQSEESLLALESQPVIAAMLSAQQAAGWLDSNRADGEVVAGFTRISGLGWYVISQQPVADALAPVYSGREIAFGLLLLLVTAAVAAGWWIAGKTTEPLASLSRAVLALGEGDTGVPLPRSRVQEIASLAAAFGDMRARLAARTQERVIAENALRQAKGDLENRVVERTIELTAELEERKRVEKTLRETRNRFQMVVDHSPLIVFTTDRDLRYTWIYPAWEGFSPDELIGRQDADIFPAGSVDEMTWLKETSLKTGRGTRGEVTLKIGNTQSIYDMSVEPLLNEQGVLSGLSVAAMDITERRRLEEEMRRSRGQIEMQHRLIQQRELERLEIARDLHDGPVQELVGMNYTLASAAQDAGQSPLGETIQAVNRMIVKLIDDLRSFAGELRPPSMAKFGVARAIHSQVETFTQKHPEIQVDLDLEEDGQALPEQARLVLYRICQEALNNISRHAQASQVQVHLRLAAGRAILEVEDNGLGFNPPEDWLELARHGHLGVVGMRERAEALGGNLVLRSVPGEGTWIHVQVPVDPSTEVGGETLPG
ncbi:MAG TPA: PAS domain-containing protein, partial [Anaerolineaceae bacterium]